MQELTPSPAEGRLQVPEERSGFMPSDQPISSVIAARELNGDLPLWHPRRSRGTLIFLEEANHGTRIHNHDLSPTPEVH